MRHGIMLVEDNEDDIFFMKRALEKAGVPDPLHVASDGHEAIEFLRQVVTGSDGRPKDAPTVPCLVLLDLKLPKIPGLDVLKWIREQPLLKTMPVIVLSTSRDDHDVADAYKLGANSYFAKPSETDRLVELIKLLRDYWLKSCIPRACIDSLAEHCADQSKISRLRS